MNATTFFSLTSNVALFFMALYFLFKIRPVKAALVYHTKTQAEFIAAIGLTLVFSIFKYFGFGSRYSSGKCNCKYQNRRCRCCNGAAWSSAGNHCRTDLQRVSIHCRRMDSARLFCSNFLFRHRLRRYRPYP